eukprot:40672-Chlamydomonas_euryale.AAC.1
MGLGHKSHSNAPPPSCAAQHPHFTLHTPTPRSCCTWHAATTTLATCVPASRCCCAQFTSHRSTATCVSTLRSRCRWGKLGGRGGGRNRGKRERRSAMERRGAEAARTGNASEAFVPTFVSQSGQLYHLRPRPPPQPPPP